MVKTPERLRYGNPGPAALKSAPLSAIFLFLIVSTVPASGTTILVPDLVDRATTLEKEGLEHATPVVTSGVVERFNSTGESLVGWEYVFTTSGGHRLILDCGDEPGVEVTPNEVRIEYTTSNGTVQRSLSFDPEHTYLVLGLQGLRTIPVEPQQGGWELPVLIIRDHRAYEPTTYFPSFTLGKYARDVTPLARAVGLMGGWDLLVRLEVEGETVAFDLVKSDG